MTCRSLVSSILMCSICASWCCCRRRPMGQTSATPSRRATPMATERGCSPSAHSCHGIISCRCCSQGPGWDAIFGC
ncbi:hypothetical protein B0T20DRAFT_410149 [Sordaria brevicollis]|uniref:Secreted protein n=1 Tax=Sordaria brevicollis TaxID=83679 RepID=A0AAE0PGD8_SORBR|nr:hypothetical protein B0T20DRAFT_410149 [Sordaria brevicollis]